MSSAVLISDADGVSSPRWLGQIGRPSAIRYAATFPGGPSTFSCQLAVDPTLTDLTLTAGSRLWVYRGAALAWAGRLEAPVRGQTWTLSGIGLAAEAKSFAALPAGSNAYDLNSSVDQAISRGLRWSRPASLTAPPGTKAPGTATLDQVLADAVNAGVHWQVSPAGTVSTVPLPTTPAYTITPPAPPGSRTLAGHTTVLVGVYTNSGTGAQTTVTVTASAAALTAYGRLEQTLDLTGAGSMSTAAATAILTDRLALLTPRLTWSGQITLAPGDLIAVNGGLVDLGLIPAAGGVLVQTALIDPETAGDPQGGNTFVVGDAEYDGDTGALTLTPMQVSSDAFPDMLGRIAA